MIGLLWLSVVALVESSGGHSVVEGVQYPSSPEVSEIFEVATSSVVGDGPPLSSGWIAGYRMGT
jgi:hypothetical protein